MSLALTSRNRPPKMLRKEEKMTAAEWDAENAGIMKMHKQGRTCHICGAPRQFVKQALDLRKGEDRITWECFKCGVIDVQVEAVTLG